jgi:glycolate oxidase iron-sulfur subunit
MDEQTRNMISSAIPGLNPVYEDYARCIHCGLCLNACPTYRLWNLEADSPRGRIHQMIQVEQGNFPVTDSFVDHIDKCLDCRACETACPSGVEYGKLVEYARAQIERDYQRPLLARIARDLVYRRWLPHPRRIAAAARLLRFFQRSGLQSFARSTGILKLFGLADLQMLLPPVDERFFFDRLGKIFPAAGEYRARVAFFSGCVANVAFAELNAATIRVLTANGCEVVVPAEQLCCGALAAHAGIRDVARELARQNLRAFAAMDSADVDAIVTNAAGCGSTLKEYDHLFTADEPEYAQARVFAGKTRDVTEFLAALGLVAKLQPIRQRVTYQDSCHLLHGQKVREAPRTLLRSIPELKLVELPFSEICCGSAGVYNVTQTEASLDLLAEKMRHARSTEAQIIATSNPGCLLQMRAGARIYNTNQQVLHVIEVLDQAISLSQQETLIRNTPSNPL